MLGDINFFGFWDHPEKRIDFDAARAHYLKAAECDPANGSPWLTLWTDAVRIGDADLERRALESLDRTGFFPPSARAYAQWMLRDLPADAILITNGDMDTFPPCMLQVTENLHPDVLVVNRSLLNADWFSQAVSARWGFPLPDGELKPYRAEDGRSSTPTRPSSGTGSSIRS